MRSYLLVAFAGKLREGCRRGVGLKLPMPLGILALNLLKASVAAKEGGSREVGSAGGLQSAEVPSASAELASRKVTPTVM